jgi:hypothetical protein
MAGRVAFDVGFGCMRVVPFLCWKEADLKR